MKLNIKVGVVKYSGGNSLTLKAKVGTLARGIFFLFFPTYLLVPINYDEAEGENYRLLLQMTQAGVREGVVE